MFTACFPYCISRREVENESGVASKRVLHQSLFFFELPLRKTFPSAKKEGIMAVNVWDKCKTSVKSILGYTIEEDGEGTSSLTVLHGFSFTVGETARVSLMIWGQQNQNDYILSWREKDSHYTDFLIKSLTPHSPFSIISYKTREITVRRIMKDSIIILRLWKIRDIVGKQTRIKEPWQRTRDNDCHSLLTTTIDDVSVICGWY